MLRLALSFTQDAQMKHTDLSAAPSANTDLRVGPIESPLSYLLTQPPSSSPSYPSLARLTALDAGGNAMVEVAFDAATRAVIARSCVALTSAMVGQDVLVVFIDGHADKPVIVGVVQTAPVAGQPCQVESDGEQVVISARSEIVLRCGNASITLTKAGKVLLNGAYVSSRSSGVNRIRGGSVEIN